MSHWLFSYGTLKDPRIQQELFGKILSFKDGLIKDWGLFVGEDGYLFVKPLEGETLSGVILSLSDSDLAMADLWEDLDVYDREEVTALGDDGLLRTVWLYTRRNGRGERFFLNACHAGNHDDIISEIRKMKLRCRAKKTAR